MSLIETLFSFLINLVFQSVIYVHKHKNVVLDRVLQATIGIVWQSFGSCCHFKLVLRVNNSENLLCCLLFDEQSDSLR